MSRSASASSSIDSNTTSSPSTTDLSTDLRLGLTTDSSSTSTASLHREKCADWPPIKHFLRSSLAAAGKSTFRRRQEESLFVKVYMEGLQIGRKLDLYALGSYNQLMNTLSLMFTTTILSPESDRVRCGECHIVTYEDREGDWMMVGDVPWEMFVTSVKRLKITKAQRC